MEVHANLLGWVLVLGVSAEEVTMSCKLKMIGLKLKIKSYMSS